MIAQPFPALKLSQWPDRDRMLWQSAQAQAGPFDDDAGIAASWSPSTISSCEKANGVWLAWLATTGGLDSNQHPIDRMTRERITAFYEAYRVGRAELTVAGTLRGIAYVLRASAGAI